MREIEIVN